MSDRRRSSLIEQMAMVEASQKMIDMMGESDVDDDDDDDGETGDGGRSAAYSGESDDLSTYYEPLQRERTKSNDGVSEVESDDFDEFETLDNPMPLEYQWKQTALQQQNSATLSDDDDDDDDDDNDDHHDDDDDDDDAVEIVFETSAGLSNPSWTVDRSAEIGGPDELGASGSMNDMEISCSSAPAFSGRHAPTRASFAETAPSAPMPRLERRRPLSFSVPNEQNLNRSASRRRGEIMSFSAPSVDSHSGHMDDDATTSSGGSGLLGSIRVGKRRSTRRQNLSVMGKSANFGSLDNAIASLRKQDSNSEWENVAAAAAVVAASAQGGSSKSRHVQFAVNDTVLVFLTLLNVTNMEDPKDTFTIAPVNKYGFPAGEGTTEAEKSGPYSFVLASVKHVHFDEDDRYYTVVRADTGTEQRADSGWMELLNDYVGIEAATRAASKTVRSIQEKPMEEVEEAGFLAQAADCIFDMVSWPADFALQTLVPWYRYQRATTKDYVTRLMFGSAPFACEFRITGINILVFCSFVFLLLEIVNLAFLPAQFDRVVAIIGVVVWTVLVLELAFEVLIRPSGYGELITSDKAFAPHVARFINKFHLVFELAALLTFIPEFSCTRRDGDMCERYSAFSRVQASLDAVVGENRLVAVRGRFILGITSLRFFAVIRHWKQMWINSQPMRLDGKKWVRTRLAASISMKADERALKKSESQHIEDDDDGGHGDRNDDIDSLEMSTSEEDERLKNAATIGTALMVVNSHRALILLTAIAVVVPILTAFVQLNHVAPEMVKLLQVNNELAFDDCDYLESAVSSWLKVAAQPQPDAVLKLQATFVLWAQVLPPRCSIPDDGVITSCDENLRSSSLEVCNVWDNHRPPDASDASPHYFAKNLHLRLGGIEQISAQSIQFDGYEVNVIFNQNPTIALANMGLFFFLLGILIMGVYGLQTLNSDAIRLVLDPLQRMLKIVLRYAENPLSQDANDKAENGKKGDDNENEEAIGNYETEQLINAITKIADLLRKCWGIAGAGIISSNLARTKDGKTVVFNPTVPGKLVYALFGFVAINGFSDQLRALDRDVMILINDVAKVVHDEVYRWALGDSGQCNKNLGAAFLMVFRIGNFEEVHDKKRRAQDVVFNTHAKSNAKKSANLRRRNRTSGCPHNGLKRGKGGGSDADGVLQLASLPGIQSFTDRALLGMLKSFAGIHRDRSMNQWKNDFRLSAGVHAYTVDIIYGMDAGWAVEGAVGSEYKIDATYLSPHVNMASRMMSAAKQYGVTILLSKAVEELLSRPCRKKLRHLDTVYVKGSKVKQDIFTYDARHEGVDFFLIERTPEQADLEAESYTSSIWEIDQDLKAMRQHITDEFFDTFSMGVKQYLSGKWKAAVQTLKKADDMMIQSVLEDGFLEYDLDELDGVYDRHTTDEESIRIRNEIGDGACRVLIHYMERRKCEKPSDWDSVRALSSK